VALIIDGLLLEILFGNVVFNDVSFIIFYGLGLFLGNSDADDGT
jgi:hypothetical protein